MERYRTIAVEAKDEFVEKRSRFIGHVKPVTTEEEAQAFIAARKKEFWDATHNVWAYVLDGGRIRRYSDDGEPQGTAGIPTLDVLLKSDVTDCVVVVTRYFGGVLLGAGGLVRAYSHGASLALAAGGIIERRLCDELAVTCDYAQYGRVGPLVASRGGVLTDTVFTDEVTLRFYLPLGESDGMQAALTEASAGTLTLIKEGQSYRDFPVE